MRAVFAHPALEGVEGRCWSIERASNDGKSPHVVISCKLDYLTSSHRQSTVQKTRDLVVG